MRKVRAGCKIFLLILWTLFWMPWQKLAISFAGGSYGYFIPALYHAGCCKIFNIRIQIKGKAVSKNHVFFAGNHLSHFDIFILGSLLKASFIAKEDIAGWPVFGTLARLNQSVFISRNSKDANKAFSDIKAMLDRGKNVILFPEGTSTRGDRILNFKSSLFSLPLLFSGKGLTLQPFTLILKTVDGRSDLNKDLRDLYGWDQDNPIEIGAHIWNFAQTKGADLDVIFHEPVLLSPEDDRKVLAARIQEIVKEPLEAA